MTAPEYKQCRFTLAWVGRCKKPCIGDFCEAHDGIKCSSCGAQATGQCDFAGQFVCGAPLCDDCHGYSEPGPSGAWGFLNHRHKRKDAPKQAEVDKIEKEEQAQLNATSAALGVPKELE